MTNAASPLMGLSALFLAAALASATAAATTNPVGIATSPAMSERTAQSQVRAETAHGDASPTDAAVDKRKHKRAICPAPSKTSFACRSRR